jgi:hypothetical protein
MRYSFLLLASAYATVLGAQEMADMPETHYVRSGDVFIA